MHDFDKYAKPSLTFMAITARAANHAVEELKKGKYLEG